MKAHYWFILFLWVAVRMEAGGKMAVSPSATEMLLPFPSHDVELASSWVKQREDLNTAFLRSLEPDRLLHNFRVNAGLSSVAKPLEGWESPGVGLRDISWDIIFRLYQPWWRDMKTPGWHGTWRRSSRACMPASKHTETVI